MNNECYKRNSDVKSSFGYSLYVNTFSPLIIHVEDGKRINQYCQIEYEI